MEARAIQVIVSQYAKLTVVGATSVAVAQGRACGGFSSAIVASYATLYIQNDTLPVGTCGNAFLSLASAANYKITQTVQLSTNFASFSKPIVYAVRNTEHHAIVGALIGDGIQVVTCCVELTFAG
jgi:hypothetical protein